MATPTPISLLPEITALAETDLMVGVDLAQPAGTQTGKFQVGQLGALTAVAGYLSGNTQTITTTPTPITGWTSSGSNFMTVNQSTGEITILQDGFYLIAATIVTSYGSNNNSLILSADTNGTAAQLISSSLTRTDGTGTVTASYGLPLTTGDAERLLISVSAASTPSDITAANFTITRIA